MGPLAEAECPPGAGLLRRKQSTAVNSVKDPLRMRNIATKSPAPSTANGVSGLPGQSVMLSMGMETSTARGCTLSQPCLEAKNVKETATKRKLATISLSADRGSSNKPTRSTGWRTSWKTESKSCNVSNNKLKC